VPPARTTIGNCSRTATGSFWWRSREKFRRSAQHIVGDQGIYEVAPDGRIVWEWKAGDHLDEFGFTPDGFEYLRRSVARQPDNIWGYLEINSAKTLGPNHWHRDDPGTVSTPTTS
jgi:hypothetical protein